MSLNPVKFLAKLKRRHRPSESFSPTGLTHMSMITPTSTPNGEGAKELIFEIEEGAIWISGGVICMLLKPDAEVKRHMLDRYANEIDDKVVIEKINRPAGKGGVIKEKLKDLGFRKR